MKKYFKYAIIAIAGSMLIFLTIRVLKSRDKPVVVINTTKVQYGSIATSVTATGTVEPVDQVEVGTQVSGLVNKIHVDYNSIVHKGQLLAELDKTNLNEAVNNAKASYDAALNELNYYQLNFTRQKKMFDAGVISNADYEQASYQVKNAAAVAAQRKTNLLQAQTNLGYANIYSPIDGVIITKEVEEGQTVVAAMSTPTLFTIAKDITKMQVEADVDEADIGGVKEGQRVSFTVDAFPEIAFSGKVKQVRLGATTTSNVVTYTVIIDADNPEQKLKPGLTATITVYTKELNGIKTIAAQAQNFIPDSSLISDYYVQTDIESPFPTIPHSGDKKFVWIKTTNGILEAREIRTGDSDGINVEVISGLQEGELVVTKMERQSVKGTRDAEAGGSPFMPKPPSGSGKKTGAK
ncbi:MAG: efflux RND transporter periplasmic adaptor subunit [Chitinophagaceae bacterium]|jgi:HlyD family secretion protein